MPAITMKEMRINKNYIEINPKEDAQLKLNVSIKTKLDTPKDNKNKTVVFHLELQAKAEEDLLSVTVEAVFLFELDEVPEKYSDEFSEHCAKIGLEKISEAIDNTLVTMGYNKLGISDSINM